ncbi:MAG: VWA domain-containing protein [Planctomycetaceae bacterium]
MTLLNAAALFAAAAVIVPILIHLQKRRKSKVVDWPAMQFLQRTVTIRRRGLTLENLLLLLLRCLLVLLFVFAMARPAIESGRVLPWLLFSLLAGCGLLVLTAAVVSNWTRRNRWIGVVSAVLLLVTAGAMLSTSPESLVDSDVDRDVAIVVDRSLTMTLGDEENTHFNSAISQARSLIESLSGNSTVSIVLAGPIPETVDGSPFRNLRKAEQVLDTLAPVAGGANLDLAIRQATSLVKRAPNTQKQLLLLTDDQLCTWESVDKLRLASHSFATHPASAERRRESGTANEFQRAGKEENGADSLPEIACAAIITHLPQERSNISVDRLLIDASLVTASRPVPIEVEVRNGGSTTVSDLVVKLLVDGRETATETIVQIEPGVHSTVRFLHAFSRSGQHVVSGTVDITDQLSADNRFDSVVEVIPHVSVLVVNGSTDADPAQQSATFARLALDPAGLREPPMAGDVAEADKASSRRAIIATAIDAARLNEIESLEEFQLVLLCDVPRLPSKLADRVARFVEGGGGLWVILGEQSDAAFYNHWHVPLTGDPIMPAQLGEWNRWVGKADADGDVSQLGVAQDTTGRPFIADLLERGDHDVSGISVFQFWSTTPSAQAIVGMVLTNGEALFAEQTLGRGRVLMQNISLARRDSNLPTSLAFPVLMHLWAYHLATSQEKETNFEPTADLVTELAAQTDPADRMTMLQMIEPDGTTRKVPVSWKQDSPFARIGQVIAPGVYGLQNTQSAALVSRFAIQRDRAESDLSVASADRLEEISHGLGIEFIDDVSQLNASVATASVGTEIWDTLLFTVLWLLAGECLLTKWIRSRRAEPLIESSASNDSLGRFALVPPSATAMESSDHWQDAPVDKSAALFQGAP